MLCTMSPIMKILVFEVTRDNTPQASGGLHNEDQLQDQLVGYHQYTAYFLILRYFLNSSEQ